jgi:hypothetical protein
MQRADPAVVRRVRSEETEPERYEAEQREEENIRELHSGAAISGRWRDLQQASAPVGQSFSPFPSRDRSKRLFGRRRKSARSTSTFRAPAGFTCRRMALTRQS